MSKLSKKLFLSVITLVFTVMAMVATTYAWFTIGDTATVGDVNGSVQGAEGLEIKFSDEDEWYSSINEATMSAYLEANEMDAPLKALSSRDGIKFNSILDIEFDSIEDVFKFNGNEEDGFIEFTLDFRTSSNDKNVVLSKLQILDNDAGALAWAVDKGHDGTAGELTSASSLNTSAAYAVRVALAQTVGSVESAVVYELANNVNLTDEEEGIANTAQEFKVAGAHDYFIKKGNTLLGVSESETYETELQAELTKLYNSGYNDTQTTDNTSALSDVVIELTQSGDWYTGSVTVRIWIEGFDADAYNAIYEGKFAVNLEFTLEDK